MVWQEIGISLLAPLVRSVGGWLENSLEDGVIQRVELAKLGGTLVRVGLVSVGAWVGFQSMGVNMPALATGAGAIVFDYLIVALKGKKKQVKKKIIKKKE